jgi:pimeloyl-ACP methyl ester carboxylesterase
MVAYAYASQYPSEVDRIVLMDAFLPGVGDWRNVWLMRDLWHFHFYGKTPLALVHGRERIYFEHFWNDFAANPKHSVPERDRRIYAKAYGRPGGMRSGFECFRAFEKDAEDFARFAKAPLPTPMLVLTGEKASGDFLIQQGRLVATNVEGVVVRGSGHWLMDENPAYIVALIRDFLQDPMCFRTRRAFHICENYDGNRGIDVCSGNASVGGDCLSWWFWQLQKHLNTCP